MKRWKTCWAAVCFCLLINFSVGAAETTVAPAGDSAGVPVAVIEEHRYAFPPVPEGTDITHDFVIRNRGTAPLKIERVKTG